MASETDVPEPNLIERLINSRNRDLSLFLPIILGFNPREISPDPDQESSDPPTPRASRDRIILINPVTQGMVVIEGSSSSLDSLLRDLLSKDGQPPASRQSIEALENVEIRDGEDGECVICLEEWGVGDVAKEMPCKHRFHDGCIEKWLGIHGSCPVCRHKMPVDEDLNKKSGGGSGGGGDEGRGRGRRREIWVTFSFNSDRRSGDTNQTASSGSSDSNSAPPRSHHGDRVEG